MRLQDDSHHRDSPSGLWLAAPLWSDGSQPSYISQSTYHHSRLSPESDRCTVLIHPQNSRPHTEGSHLCDHREAHNEEADTAAQGEHRLVCAQVLGELIRNGGHDGLDGGKLKQDQDKSM